MVHLATNKMADEKGKKLLSVAAMTSQELAKLALEDAMLAEHSSGEDSSGDDDDDIRYLFCSNVILVLEHNSLFCPVSGLVNKCQQEFRNGLELDSNLEV